MLPNNLKIFFRLRSGGSVAYVFTSLRCYDARAENVKIQGGTFKTSSGDSVAFVIEQFKISVRVHLLMFVLFRESSEVVSRKLPN